MSEELILAENRLPTNIEDLSKFVLVGREKLNAVRAEIRAIEKVGLAKEVHEQKLKEAQAISEAVLDAEVRIGELMRDVPKATAFNNPSGKSKEITQSDTNVTLGRPKTEALRELGFSGSDDNIRKQVQRFQTMAAHPEIVAQAKAEAKENGEVVSRSAVLKKIDDNKKAEKKAERQNVIETQIEKPKSSNYVDIYTTEKKYRVVYADPPWSYNDKQDTEKLGGAVKFYPTMAISEICELPVPTENNAVLFLWVTSPLLEDAFKVIKAWGFKYKSSFVWDKVAHNMGHYNSVRHEFLLICTKGSCTPDVVKLYDSVVSIERTEHSRKPKEFRDMIDTLYPIGERLEMFAREAPDGWDVWGNMA